MNNRNLFVIIVLCFLTFACGSNADAKKKQFSIKIDGDTSKFKLGETVKASILNPKKIEIDSVTYFFEDTKLTTTDKTLLVEKIDDERLGKHLLKAIVSVSYTHLTLPTTSRV